MWFDERKPKNSMWHMYMSDLYAFMRKVIFETNISSVEN